ncbi:MAG: TrkA C-terminal domain-containing protein [Oscillospiraceae bacterium]|nr:TrkA C-terminal domain-containing protein [Oscillospiraceae bacterium]
MPIPQYMRIAMDLSSRVASGEIQEGRKISGRSMLSSQYHVSPETVRKAMGLLNDMKVVEIKEKSGVTILSAENARLFLAKFDTQREQQSLRERLQALAEQQQALSRELTEVCGKLLLAQTTPLPAEKRLPNYEIEVPADSDKVGRSIGSLHFWQATGATIIAIRRRQNTILSPGPYAELLAGDIVVFVGAAEAARAVELFLRSAGQPQGE